MRSRGDEKVRLRSPPRSRDYRTDHRLNPHDHDGRSRPLRSLTPPEQERSRRADHDGRRLFGEEHSYLHLERRHYSRHYVDGREPLERDRSHRIGDEDRVVMWDGHRNVSLEKEYTRRFIDNEEEVEFKRKYLSGDPTDLNIGTGTSYKQISESVTAPRARRDKELLCDRPSDLDRTGLVQKSMRFKDGTVRTSFLLPQELGYSKAPSQTMLTSGKYNETFPSLTSMLDRDYLGCRGNAYQSNLVRQPYGEQGKNAYLKDVSYPRVPFSSSQDCGSSSYTCAKDDSLSYYQDGQFGTGDSKFKDIDFYSYGQPFDSSHPVHVKDFKLSQRDALSPMRSESFNYRYSELSQRGKNSLGVTTEEPYKMTKSIPQEDYACRESLGRSLLDSLGDRIGGTPNSLTKPRENSLWDYPPVTKYHSVERISSASDSHREYRGSESTHFQYGTKVPQDCEIVNFGNDYVYGRDAGLTDVYRERQMDPTLEQDTNAYRHLLSPKQTSSEELVLHPSERMTENNYIIGDVRGHIPELSRPKSRNIFERIRCRDEQWMSEEPDRILPSSKAAFGRVQYRMPSRAIMPKRKLRPSQPAFQKKFSVDKKKDFYRPSKFQKGALEDTHENEIPDNECPSHGTNPLVKVDPPEGSEEFKQLLHKAFLRFTKQLNDSILEQKKYQEQGKAISLHCIVCGSLSKEFNNTHGLVTHAFSSLKGLRTEHLGLHKALCIMLGWDSSVAPDISKRYQSMSAAEAASLREDLILWPPVVVIHNSSVQEILTSERMEELLKAMCVNGGKTKVCSGKHGNDRLLLVKFMPTFSGLQEAEQLHKYFDKKKRGRGEWKQMSTKGSNNGCNGGEGHEQEKMELFLYGYLGAAEDVWKLDDETKKRSVIKSKKEINAIADASLEGLVCVR
ncbi:uncharacterized protein [Aristolochia californica]|uniref:uncharacterized protein n=1 Tax=Aristolochia californica TaxID=171875 RepID=UPI0035E24E0F